MNDLTPKPMTADFLKKRGTCCKTACLHCPYGFTIKKLRLMFRDVTTLDHDQMLELKGSAIDLATYTYENYKFITLKDQVCGLIRIDKLFVREFYLGHDFKEQGITKELVESYYFC